MGRRPRRELPELGFFHVTARGTGGTPIYADAADRRTFCDLLASVCARWEWSCHAYCLMTTHYHLVIEAERSMLSRGMASLNSRYAQYFNKRHERFGHLFAGRFTSYVIDSEEHFEAAVQYVLENPVHAGLCKEWQAWPWSGLELSPQRGTVPQRRVGAASGGT